MQALPNKYNVLVCSGDSVREVRVEEPDNMRIRLSREKKRDKAQPRMRNRGLVGSGDTWPEGRQTALDKRVGSLTEEGSA